MFKAIYKEKKKSKPGVIKYYHVTVYDIMRDKSNGYPHFLIYHEGQWRYISAKHFIVENNEVQIEKGVGKYWKMI